jgi:hypothetical protein
VERRPALRVAVAVAAVAGVAGVAILLNLVLLGFANDPGGPDPGLRPTLPQPQVAPVTAQATEPSEPTVTVASTTTIPAQPDTGAGSGPTAPEVPASSDSEPADD